MRILITNDDGINAPGLKALEAIAAALSDDVWMVAPETEQSAVSHSLTMHNPVRLREVGERKYHVTGTPTDCVLLAMKVVFGKEHKKPDMILSGVNYGSNLCEDVTYSGTVAAAMEGTLLGIPAIALSQNYADSGTPPWQTAIDHAPKVIKKLLEIGWPKNTLMNVNFPDLPAKDVKGIKVAPQGVRSIGESVHLRHDLRGRTYYWIGGSNRHVMSSKGSDIEAVIDGYISVTPIGLDLTDYKTLEAIKDRF